MARSASVRMATTTIDRRKPGRPKGSTNKVPAKLKPSSLSSQRTPRAAVAKATKPVRRAAPVVGVEAVPKVSKDELRAQVQKLTASVATLRARLREATRAAKLAASWIADLEEQVAQHERNARPIGAEQGGSGKVTRAKGTRRRTTHHDFGDAVSPSGAVEGPLPVDDEAEAA